MKLNLQLGLAVLLFVCFGTVAVAQSEFDAAPNQTEVDQASIDALLGTMKRVRQRIDNADGLATPMYSQPHRSLPPGTGNSVDDIRQRIKLLQKLRQKGNSSKRTSAADAKSDSSTETRTSEPTVTPRREQRTPSSPLRPPTLNDIEQSLRPAPNMPLGNSEQRRVLEMQATEVLAVAVNHLELGQSLYRTRNYAAALQSLNALDPKSLSPADAMWSELLIAMCHRRMGNVEETDTVFRQLANENKSDFPVLISRWWLSQSEATIKTREFAGKVAESIDPLIKRAKNYVPRE